MTAKEPRRPTVTLDSRLAGAAAILAVAAILAACGFGAYVYAVDSDFGGPFWQQAAAAFLAATLAVAIGIPAGLWVNDLTHHAEIREQQAHEHELRLQTLKSLAEELGQANQIHAMVGRIPGTDPLLIGPSRVAWQAASEAGNLRLLRPQTLTLLVKAYHRVDELTRGHKMVIDAWSSEGGSAMTVEGKPVLEVTTRTLKFLAEDAYPIILEAIKQLGADLEEHAAADASEVDEIQS